MLIDFTVFTIPEIIEFLEKPELLAVKVKEAKALLSS